MPRHSVNMYGNTVIEYARQLMTPFDSDMAAFIHSEMRKHGVRLILGRAVEGLEEKDRALKVLLEDDAPLYADMVVLTVGVTPDTALAEDAGLELGMKGAIARAEELSREIDGAFLAGQFVNPENPNAHYLTTGPEIYSDTDGEVDILVAGVGTGGTLTGTARYLKEKNPAVLAVAVEPSGSPVLSGGASGAHGLQGIGAGFIPEVLDTTLINEIKRVTEGEAYAASRELGSVEGILVGISSGAALSAAIDIASRPENEDKTVVVILPDTGERYLSTPLFTK